jgi:LEA14-like dessication related protein
MTAETSAVADLGFAEVPMALPGQNRTFETDMLAGFSGVSEEITVRGRTVATLHGMTADWGDPTMARTPMAISGEVTNEGRRSLTVVKFGYRVTMNDVVLADNQSRVGTTIPAGTTQSLSTTGYLDNDQIPEWWVSHLQNGERSELSVSYYAIIEYDGQRYRVELDTMSYSQTIETNAFGGESGE